MTTDELIRRLADDTPAMPRHAVGRRLTLALGVGALGAIMALWLTLGHPFHGLRTIALGDYGVKLAFTAALTLIAARLLAAAARPDGRRTGAAGWLAAPVLLLAAIAGLGLARTPEGARDAFVLGSTWRTCLPSIIAFAVPAFAALLVAFRRLAPTDLPRAGILAGLSAGALSAGVYSLHCPETSPAFLLVWYGLGIAACGALGRLIGPRLLRW